ncbi:LrgB family protein [Paraburkholderia sp. PGU19]
MVVAQKVGGAPSLTAALVISTGVFGAVTARWSLGASCA